MLVYFQNSVTASLIQCSHPKLGMGLENYLHKRMRLCSTIHAPWPLLPPHLYEITSLQTLGTRYQLVLVLTSNTTKAKSCTSACYGGESAECSFCKRMVRNKGIEVPQVSETWVCIMWSATPVEPLISWPHKSLRSSQEDCGPRLLWETHPPVVLTAALFWCGPSSRLAWRLPQSLTLLSLPTTYILCVYDTALIVAATKVQTEASSPVSGT